MEVESEDEQGVVTWILYCDGCGARLPGTSPRTHRETWSDGAKAGWVRFSYAWICPDCIEDCYDVVRPDARAELEAEVEHYKRECAQWSDAAKDVFSYDHMERANKMELERDALQARLDCTRCNSGHETLPLKLWDCPACTKEKVDALQAKLDEAVGLLDRCSEVHWYAPTTLSYSTSGGERQECNECGDSGKHADDCAWWVLDQDVDAFLTRVRPAQEPDPDA